MFLEKRLSDGRGIGLAGLELAFQGVTMSSRQLGSGSQAEGASSASDAELAKALDALRTDKDFAAMEAEASKLWGKNIGKIGDTDNLITY